MGSLGVAERFRKAANYPQNFHQDDAAILYPNSAPLLANFLGRLHIHILRDILIQGLAALVGTNLRTKSENVFPS